MVVRVALAFLLFASASGSSALSAEIDRVSAYYGENLTLVAKGPALRSKLEQVLRSPHTPVAGGYDQIGSCGRGCYKHTAVGYQRARQILFGEIYLVKQGETYGVKDLYCQRVVFEDEFRGEKPGPGRIPDHRVVNIEHTWPQSQFTRSYPDEDQKSDMHHLYPTDSEMNNKRSSLDFGDVVSDDSPLKCSQSRLGTPRGGGTVFEPPQSHKGNVARSLFYFAVRYGLRIGPAEELALREWSRLDPVDAEERERNEKIFDYQKDRNPFVDFPELADRITDF